MQALSLYVTRRGMREGSTTDVITCQYRHQGRHGAIFLQLSDISSGSEGLWCFNELDVWPFIRIWALCKRSKHPARWCSGEVQPSGYGNSYTSEYSCKRRHHLRPAQYSALPID